MRILITASRGWPSEKLYLIHSTLNDRLSMTESSGDRLTIVHGGARGGDQMADAWVRMKIKGGYRIDQPEIHRARWHAPCDFHRGCVPGHRRRDRFSAETVCPLQGFYRNEYMVSLGPYDECLAFIYQGSRGASQCARAANAAGIPVTTIRT